jgi:Flp pilus assembly protein TadD
VQQPLRRGGWIAALVTLALAFPILGHGFLLDDFVLFQTSASLRDLGSVPRGFTHDVGAIRKGTETVNSNYYRPLFLALSTLYFQAVGGGPRPWHAASLLLDGAIALLAWRFLSRRMADPWAALFGTLVFALHPAHVSSVAWASGLQELLAAFFVLLALVLVERGGPTTGWTAVILPAVCLLAAMLCKEVALASILWCVVAWRLEPEAALRARYGRLAALSAGLGALYLGARIGALGGLGQPPANAPTLGHALASAPVALWTYVELLVAPLGFSIFRPDRPVHSFGDPVVILAGLALVALAGVVLWRARTRPAILAPGAWIVVWVLPVLDLRMLDPQWMVTDRYLFLPALGLPWLLGAVLPQRAARPTLAVLAVLFAALTLRYQSIFADAETFLAAMAQAEPTSTLVQTERGRLLAQRHDLAGARAAYARAVELDPTAPGALVPLGDLEIQGHELDAAERHYRQALLVEPEASAGFKRLVLAYGAQGNESRACDLAAETASRWPGDFEGQLLLAVCRGARGDRAAAADALANARRLRPAAPEIQGAETTVLDRLTPLVLPRHAAAAKPGGTT